MESSSSSFYFPAHLHNSNSNSNSPPELSNSNSSPDSSSSDGTAGEDPSSSLHQEGRRNTIRLDKPFTSTTTNHYPFIHPHPMNGNDKVHQSQLPFNMNHFSNDNAAVYSPFQNGSGQVGSPHSTTGNSRIGKSSDSSTLSELTSSDDDVSIFGNGSNHGNPPNGNAVVALGNSMFSYTKNFTSEPTSSGLPRNGNSSGQGRSSLEDWNSNVNQHQQQHQNGLTSDFNRLHNGSLTQPYNDPVRNGRNPPTTIPRLHSNSVSHSSRPFNGVGSSNAMQLDGNGSGNADGDEDMFESLIQEDSFDPPSLRNSVSPQQSLKMLPQAGLSISTAPDRIPPSYYPSQSGLRNSKGSGRISAGAEGESGSPPLSADPSVLSSRRNSISERNGDQSMESATGISALTPSIGGTSSYASGDDDPLPSSATSHHDNGHFLNQATSTPSNAPKSKNSKSKSTSNPIPIDTGLTPEGEIPFSSKEKDLVHPSISDLNEEGTGKLQVHVHGLPRKGAKSRVETQVKMRLELVREKIGNQGASSSSTSTSDEKEWERIGSFTHLKLPPFSGSKRSQKKFQFDNVDPEKTLFVDVVVVKASPPHEKVTICEHCIKREARKAQRGKDTSIKEVKKGRNDEDNATDEDDYEFFGIDRSLENSKELLKEKSAEAELNRSVVFNCGDYLEFEDGNVVLPTRITCYCRHHSEKLGFCIIFTMRDWQSNVVATGSTPPIMITDDHKATSKAQKEKAEEGSGAIASTSGNGSGSGKKKSTSKSKNTKASVSTLAKAGKASERGVGRSTYNSAASRVSSPSKDTPPDASQTDTLQDPSNQPTASASAASKKRERAKPYDKSASSKSRKRSESGNASLVSSPKDPRSGNVTRSVTPANSSSSPHHQPPFSTIEQNEDWTSFAAAAGFMSRTASDSGRSMTTANAFSPISNSSMTAEPQSMNTAQIPPSPIAPQDEIPFHMQGSLSSTNLQTNLQSTPAFNLERFLRDAQGGIPVDSSGLQEFIALNGGSRVGNENGNGMDLDTINPQQQHLQQPQFSHSEPQSNYQNAFHQPAPSTSTLQQPQLPTSISSQSPPPASMVPSIPAPRVEKLIPGEGPTSGGVEVTVLGSGFLPGLRCVFGDVQAAETKVWASNTLVCVLPPSQSPGPVVVSLKRVMESGELRDFDGSNDHNNHPLRFFTYVDKTDRALMELALQVVGLQMTGQMQSARDVAMRVVGSGGAGSNGPSPNGGGGSSSTPSGQSRSIAAPSGTDEISGLFAAGRGSTQSFQTSLLGFLSLLDVDFSNESTLPNGVPRLDALRLANSQGHTLLHLAVILGLHKLVEALLARKHPAPVNARDKNGYTALHFAALHGRMTIARTLLSRKARDDLVNVEGKIPLELAREKDQVDVEMLLSENSSENVRIRMMMDPSPRLSVSESESVSDEDQDGESIENSSEEEEEDIDEDNISTCASHVETSSDEGSSQEDVDEELLNSQVDLNVEPSSIVEKGIQTPQALSTPQDEKKEPLFSSKLDERKDRESSKLQKEKEKEVESTNNSPGTETNLAFKDWLIQAGDSVRAGHGLEWAASNLPSGRRALQLIPRPNMALNMHMPAVPVFHLTLPTTPRFGNLPWTNSNSSSTATTPSASSSKGKDRELTQSNSEGSSKAHTNEEIHSSHSLSGAEAWASDEARRVINMCKSIVEESALWLNPLYQPLDSSPPPTYESALASTSKEDLTQDSRLVEDDELKDQGLQLQSGEESKISKSSSTNHRRPSVTSRSTWNGKASDRMEDESALIDLRENEIAGPSSKRITRPSSALSGPSSSSNLLSSSSASSAPSSTSIQASSSTSTSTASTSCNRRRTRTQTQPRRGLRDDLMLIFFWFPALLVVILLLFFSKNSSIFSLDELLSFIPGPIATATKVVRSGSSSKTAVETSPF